MSSTPAPPRRGLTTLTAAVVRLPGAMLPVALLGAVAVSTGSLALGGAAAAVGLLGAALSPLLMEPLAVRRGFRPVLLVLAALHVILLLLLAAAVERGIGQSAQTGLAMLAVLCIGLALAGGLTVPPVSVMVRGDAGGRRGGLRNGGMPLRQSPRRDAAAEDVALVAGPALAGILSYGFGAAAGLAGAAALTTMIIPLAIWERSGPENPEGSQSSDSPEAEAETVDEESLGGPGPEELRSVLWAPLPGLGHARRLLAEARGLSPEGFGGSVREVPPVAGRWPQALPAVLLSAAGVGLVLAGLWATLLDIGRAGGHPELLGLGAAGVALAAAFSSRRLPRRFGRLDELRRRRLFSVAGALLAIGLLPAAVLVQATAPGQLLVAALVLLLGACLGAVVVGLHLPVIERAPSSALPQVASAISGAGLCGLTVGITAAGLAADELGRGWGSLAALLGFLALAAAVLRRGEVQASS